MDVIKFRGLRVDNREWAHGSYHFSHLEEMHCISFVNALDDDDWHFVAGKTVGQFTGLQDKNGVEIFEGDILRILEISNSSEREYVTDVLWEECAFVLKSGGDDYDTFMSAWAGDPEKTYPLFELEVIGSIHTTPELLT